MVRRALISVYDKTGVVEFARGLHELGVEIISTGGTYKAIRDAGIPVLEVAQVGGFPEILDGRVKTLQPRIHAGILAVRANPEHMAQLEEHGITPIDLVAVNLYPFRETVANPNVTLPEAIEKIDIGGPSMVRGAAKNWQDVAVVVSPARYGQILDELKRAGEISLATKFDLMLEAFRHTAEYDTAIAGWMATRGRALFAGQGQGALPHGEPGAGNGAPAFPEVLTLRLSKIQDLRYGENPHQRAAFYRAEELPAGASIAGARQLHGKELSFNNINDAHAALELVKEFDRPAAVAVKHANPCGVAVADTLAEAYRKAYDADPVSIFGGILALNRPLDVATAEAIREHKVFLEIVIAPGYEPEALELMKKKSRDVRLLEVGEPGRPGPAGYDVKRVHGGYLVQDWDAPAEAAGAWRVVTEKQVSPALLADLEFAWKVCKHVKSNAIVVARDGQTLGVGAGQMNRIDAARFALQHALEILKSDRLAGCVLASDAFFPFPDVVEAAGAAGITAIVQPGGALRDEQSIARANELGLAMVFTGIRHFKH